MLATHYCNTFRVSCLVCVWYFASTMWNVATKRVLNFSSPQTNGNRSTEHMVLCAVFEVTVNTLLSVSFSAAASCIADSLSVLWNSTPSTRFTSIHTLGSVYIQNLRRTARAAYEKSRHGSLSATLLHLSATWLQAFGVATMAIASVQAVKAIEPALAIAWLQIHHPPNFSPIYFSSFTQRMGVYHFHI